MQKSFYLSNYWPETQKTAPITKTIITNKATLASDLLSLLASLDSKYSSYLSDIIIPRVLRLLCPVGRPSESDQSHGLNFPL